VSRVNLALATGGFIGSTAWVLLMVLLALPMALDSGPTFLPGPGLAVFAAEHGHGLRAQDRGADRGRLNRRPPALRRWARLLLGAVGDMLFSVLMAPILAVAHAFFIGGLMFGRAAVWGAQRRVVHWVGPLAALRRLWPQTLFGIAGVAWFWVLQPARRAVLLALLRHRGLAVPIAVVTSCRCSGGSRPASASGASRRRPRRRRWSPRCTCLPCPRVSGAAPARWARPPSRPPTELVVRPATTRTGRRSAARLPARVRSGLGMLRSLRIYYRRERRPGLDRMHARFAGRGDLAFDIGSHVGDRIASFRRLGLRVVAVEPQPALARLLRLLYGRDREVTVVQAAVGAEPGETTLHLNLDNPTVTTLSADFMRAADGAPGWLGQRWERRVSVPVTTLDALIARFGEPRFIKIDVEGYEDQVLRGLRRHAIRPGLSFEFTTIQRPVAHAALDECERLGARRFNAALGESQRLLQHAQWIDADGIAPGSTRCLTKPTPATSMRSPTSKRCPRARSGV
jgi:FkbM family methyltransferase